MVTRSSNLKSAFLEPNLIQKGTKVVQCIFVQNQNHITGLIHKTHQFGDDLMNDEKTAAKCNFFWLGGQSGGASLRVVINRAYPVVQFMEDQGYLMTFQAGYGYFFLLAFWDKSMLIQLIHLIQLYQYIGSTNQSKIVSD